MRVESKSNGELSFFKRRVEAGDLTRRNSPVVGDAELRRLNVAEDRNNLLLRLHDHRELMKTEVRIAVAGRKHRHPNLAILNGAIDLVEQLVPRLHVLVVQETSDPEPRQMIVQQRRHAALRVNPPVVYENVAAFSSIVVVHELTPQIRH